MTSKSYRQFYKESVEITGTIIRESLYKKPKIRIQEIGLDQAELDFSKSHENGSFAVGRSYSRKQISEALGGSEVEYLPTHNGRIVCGCFTLEHNPGAPDVIVPGTGKIVEREAELFCQQGDAVPIFVKRRVNEWEYMGDYRVKRYSSDPQEIAANHQGSITPLHEVTRVIFLEKADQPPD
jgi:hypothetical protein